MPFQQGPRSFRSNHRRRLAGPKALTVASTKAVRRGSLMGRIIEMLVYTIIAAAQVGVAMLLLSHHSATTPSVRNAHPVRNETRGVAPATDSRNGLQRVG